MVRNTAAATVAATVLKLAVTALTLALPWVPAGPIRHLASPSTEDGMHGWSVYALLVIVITGAALFDVALGVLVTILLVALAVRAADRRESLAPAGPPLTLSLKLTSSA
jgi:hypothetical protein